MKSADSYHFSPNTERGRCYKKDRYDVRVQPSRQEGFVSHHEPPQKERIEEEGYSASLSPQHRLHASSTSKSYGRLDRPEHPARTHAQEDGNRRPPTNSADMATFRIPSIITATGRRRRRRRQLVEQEKPLSLHQPQHSYANLSRSPSPRLPPYTPPVFPASAPSSLLRHRQPPNVKRTYFCSRTCATADTPPVSRGDSEGDSVTSGWSRQHLLSSATLTKSHQDKLVSQAAPFQQPSTATLSSSRSIDTSSANTITTDNTSQRVEQFYAKCGTSAVVLGRDTLVSKSKAPKQVIPADSGFTLRQDNRGGKTNEINADDVGVSKVAILHQMKPSSFDSNSGHNHIRETDDRVAGSSPRIDITPTIATEYKQSNRTTAETVAATNPFSNQCLASVSEKSLPKNNASPFLTPQAQQKASVNSSRLTSNSYPNYSFSGGSEADARNVLIAPYLVPHEGRLKHGLKMDGVSLNKSGSNNNIEKVSKLSTPIEQQQHEVNRPESHRKVVDAQPSYIYPASSRQASRIGSLEHSFLNGSTRSSESGESDATRHNISTGSNRKVKNSQDSRNRCEKDCLPVYNRPTEKGYRLALINNTTNAQERETITNSISLENAASNGSATGNATRDSNDMGKEIKWSSRTLGTPQHITRSQEEQDVSLKQTNYLLDSLRSQEQEHPDDERNYSPQSVMTTLGQVRSPCRSDSPSTPSNIPSSQHHASPTVSSLNHSSQHVPPSFSRRKRAEQKEHKQQQIIGIPSKIGARAVCSTNRSDVFRTSRNTGDKTSRLGPILRSRSGDISTASSAVSDPSTWGFYHSASSVSSRSTTTTATTVEKQAKSRQKIRQKTGRIKKVRAKRMQNSQHRSTVLKERKANCDQDGKTDDILPESDPGTMEFKAQNKDGGVVALLPSIFSPARGVEWGDDDSTRDSYSQFSSVRWDPVEDLTSSRSENPPDANLELSTPCSTVMWELDATEHDIDNSLGQPTTRHTVLSNTTAPDVDRIGALLLSSSLSPKGKLPCNKNYRGKVSSVNYNNIHELSSVKSGPRVRWSEDTKNSEPSLSSPIQNLSPHSKGHPTNTAVGTYQKNLSHWSTLLEEKERKVATTQCRGDHAVATSHSFSSDNDPFPAISYTARHGNNENEASWCGPAADQENDRSFIKFDHDLSKNRELTSRSFSFIESVAAVVIQTFVRRHLAYNRVWERYSAVLTIQQFLVECCERQRLSIKANYGSIINTYHGAATRIQAQFRGWWIRDCQSVDHYCATLIQSVVRGFLDKIKYHYDVYCITIAQSVVRRCLAANEAKMRMADIVCIQTAFRAYVARRDFDVFLNSIVDDYSAIKIQSLWRSFVAQTNFMHILANIILIQSIVRRKLAHKALAALKQKRLVEIKADCKHDDLPSDEDRKKETDSKEAIQERKSSKQARRSLRRQQRAEKKKNRLDK